MRIAALAEFDRAKQEALLTAAHGEEISVFGRQYSRSIAWLRQCFRHHPYSFFVAVDRNCLVGQLDLWPLHRNSYFQIKNGNKCDESLSITDIADSNSCYWYSSTFIVKDYFRRNIQVNRQTLRQVEVAKLLILAMHEYLSEHVSTFPIKLLVIGSTLAGQKVATHWGMGRYSPTAMNCLPVIDPRPRYFRDFQTSEELEELIYWLPRTY